MAQLKDLIVNGASRFIGDIFANKAQLTTLEAPKTSGGTEYGPGTSGQVLKSNGSSIYWASDNNSDTLVTQTISSAETGNYRLLFSATADDTTRTETSRKDTDLRWQPSTNTLNIAANNANGIIKTTSGTFTITSASTLYLNSGTSSSILFKIGDTEQARFNSSGNFLLGVTSGQNDITTYKFYVNGTSYHNGNDTHAGNILPSAANTYTIGAASDTKDWKAVYSRNYSLYANNAWYGDFYIGTIGTANSGDNNETRGTQGEVCLRVGNNVARPAAGTAGGANNARGRVRIYNTGTGYLDIFSDSWNGQNLNVVSATDSTAGSTGQSYLIVGNSNKKSDATASSTGRLRLYGDENGRHEIYPTSTTVNYIHYLPNSAGWIATGGDGTTTGVGSSSQPVYLSTSGVITAITGNIANGTTGNAATATTLQTARTINGTSFNGSANITTVNWGTARTLTIGSTGKSVNGSENVSWSHAEIGATVSNTWTGGTTAGPTITTTVNGVTGTAVAIPSASSTTSGIVTTTTQHLGSNKIFANIDDETAANWYSKAAVLLRESDRVGNAQFTFRYAPRLGFLWNGRIAASMAFHSDGLFYLRKQSGTTRATLDANLQGYLENSNHFDRSEDYASYAWHKIATVVNTSSQADPWIKLLVSNGAGSQVFGILYARQRNSSSKVWDNGTLYWEYLGYDINPADFVMRYTNDTSTPKCTAEIWAKIPARWSGYHFIVLNRGGRSTGAQQTPVDDTTKNCYWQLAPSVSGHGDASYTTGTGGIVSTCANIKLGAIQAYGNVSVGTFTANTAQSEERNLYVKSGAGNIGFWSSAATDGKKGIWSVNAAGTGSSVLQVNQNNHIDAVARIADDTTITASSIRLKTVSRYLDWNIYKNNDRVAEIWYDTGHATNNTAGQFFWRQWSPTADANATLTSYYETYALPAVTTGRTGNGGTYNILTTKNTVTVAQGGTGVTSHTANRLVWSTSATTIQATNHYASSEKVAIHSTTEPSYNLYVDGSIGFNVGTNDTTSHKRFVIIGNNRYLSIGASGLQAYTGATDTNTASTLFLQYNGGNTQLGRSTDLPSHTTIYGNITPGVNTTYSLGSSTNKWANVYATTFNGTLDGNASSASQVAITDTAAASATTYYLTHSTGKSDNQTLRGTARLKYYDYGVANSGGWLNVGTSNYKGGITLHDNSEYYGSISVTSLTANRSYTLPDKTGTIALTDDIAWSTVGTELPENANLNTYNQTGSKLGLWYSGNSTKTATLDTPPFTFSGFRLIALAGYGTARGHQIAWGTSPTPYLRTENGTANTYSAWSKLVYIQNDSNNANVAVGSSTQPVYVNSDGSVVAITGNIANGTTGNATTATTLQTARKINGIAFNGSVDINTPFFYDAKISLNSTTAGWYKFADYTNTSSGHAVKITYFIQRGWNKKQCGILEFDISLGSGGWSDPTLKWLVRTPDMPVDCVGCVISGTTVTLYGYMDQTNQYGAMTITEIWKGNHSGDRGYTNFTYYNSSIATTPVPTFTVKSGDNGLVDQANRATAVDVTNTTPTNTTRYYLTYATSRGAEQVLRATARLNYYDTGTIGYLNIGDSQNSGVLTLHNSNGKLANIATSAFTDDRGFRLPDKSGVFALTTDVDAADIAFTRKHYNGTASGTTSDKADYTNGDWRLIATSDEFFSGSGTTRWIYFDTFDPTTYLVPEGRLFVSVYYHGNSLSVNPEIKWLYCNTKLTPQDFALTYKIDENNSNKMTVKIWARIPQQYYGVIFKEIAEGTWGSHNSLGAYWTLENSSGNLTNTQIITDITEGGTYTPVYSILAPQENNLVLQSSSGDSPALIFNRTASNNTDWKVVNTSGKLSFQSAINETTWTERAYFSDAGVLTTGENILVYKTTTSGSQVRVQNNNGAVSLLTATNRGLHDSTNNKWIIYTNQSGANTYIYNWISKGSNSQPVYFNSSGEPVAGSTYAGGTKVTLNGLDKGASTASFYAPTGAGIKGNLLKSNGSGAPTWSTSPFHTALTSKGTTATTTAGETYGVAGVAQGSSTTIYTKWYVNLDSGVTTPTNGMIIQIKIPVAGVNAGCSITLDNGSNFYPVTLSAASRITTHFGANDTITLQFDSARSVSTYGNKSGASVGNTTTTITGCWRMMNDYDSGNTNTLLRVYSSSTNIDVPLIGQSSANSTTAAWSTYTGTYKDWYGAIPNTDANRAKINLSTGKVTIPGGISLGVWDISQDDYSKLVISDAGTTVATINMNHRITSHCEDIGLYQRATTAGYAGLGLKSGSTGWEIYTNEDTLGGALFFDLNNTTKAYISDAGVWGAVWNDYAEFRKATTVEPGRCVKEVGDDTLELTTKRLERGCEIVSDTFGFAIGKTDECQTPVAASGRVLAYIYEGREAAAAHIGWPVCSGPDGTVSIMTEEEEEKYPSRIIGTISAVPDYEEWGTGKVKVNGRVWIRIK